jgi:hypothetical protein
LARSYHRSELSSELCDGVLNDLHNVIIRADEDRPDLFWKIYLAFDAGERYNNNSRDLAAENKYTRPAIARLVEHC